MLYAPLAGGHLSFGFALQAANQLRLGVFNSALMNDAVYKFKRYEDASLVYVGVNKHEGEDVGLYDTVLSATEYSGEVENVAALRK